MRTLVIEKALVKQNIAVIKEKAHGAVIYGMLSGDGGGAGTVPLAQLLRDEGITHFAVHEVEEAQALREAGFVEEEILMLRSTTDRELLEKLVDLNVVCTVSSVDTGMALNALAENVIGQLERIEDRRSLLDHLEQPVVLDHDQRVDHLA